MTAGFTFRQNEQPTQTTPSRGITMNKKLIGTNAGIIWNLLNNNQRWNISDLRVASGLTDKEIYTAIGWLARENKIEIEKSHNGDEDYYLVIEYYF
jgi:hypothetical protein